MPITTFWDTGCFNETSATRFERLWITNRGGCLRGAVGTLFDGSRANLDAASNARLLGKGRNDWLGHAAKPMHVAFKNPLASKVDFNRLQRRGAQ